jgi:hypothetical protein
MTTPRGAELWRLVMESRLLDVHTALPAKVVSFSASDQTVVVQPLIKNVIKSSDGTELVESYPQLRDIPVLYPRAGGFVVAFPIAADDVVTVLCNEWPIDNYREKGREDHPVHLDRHSFGGAVALPVGPYKSSDTISETIDALIIGHDGGAVIRIADDGTVTIGASGASTQPAALGDDVKAELDALKSTIDSFVTAYNSHIHITTATVGAGPVPGVISPTVSTATPHGTVGDVGSSKVEIEE